MIHLPSAPGAKSAPARRAPPAAIAPADRCVIKRDGTTVAPKSFISFAAHSGQFSRRSRLETF